MWEKVDIVYLEETPEVLSTFEQEQKIGDIAMKACLLGLRKETTKTLVRLQYAPESVFVQDNLSEILETIDNIFVVLNRQ